VHLVSSSLCSLVPLPLVLAAAAHAQTVVAGKIIDRDQKTAVWPASVELLGQADSVVQAGGTARDGTFSFMVPSAGMYRVRIIAQRATKFVSEPIKVADGEYVAREFALDLSRRPYQEYEVDAHVVPLMGSPQPRYPEDMRQQGISGCALAEFVVDSTGHAEIGTLRFLAFSRREFARAVADGLPRIRFAPAELRGQKVRQVVTQPFTFTVQGDFEKECKPPGGP